MKKSLKYLSLLAIVFIFAGLNASKSDIVKSPETTKACETKPGQKIDSKEIWQTTKQYADEAWNKTKSWLGSAWQQTKEGARDLRNKFNQWWSSKEEVKTTAESKTTPESKE